MEHWSDTKEGQELLEGAFKEAGMRDVRKEHLKLGTYTNREIAEKCKKQEDFLALFNITRGVHPGLNRMLFSSEVDNLNP